MFWRLRRLRSETSDQHGAMLFDFSIYVDARTEDIERWYVNRFLTLRSSALPESGVVFQALCGAER